MFIRIPDVRMQAIVKVMNFPIVFDDFRVVTDGQERSIPVVSTPNLTVMTPTLTVRAPNLTVTP